MASPVPLAGSTAPRPTTARDALHALLHTTLTLHLTDGRQLRGQLLAIDTAASLLLSNTLERRVLPDDAVGRNVAAYYPYSRAQGTEDAPGRVRERELTSVLVPIGAVESVEMGDNDAGAWSAWTGVRFEDGAAVAAK